jgi:hypothetical protein
MCVASTGGIGNSPHGRGRKHAPTVQLQGIAIWPGMGPDFPRLSRRLDRRLTVLSNNALKFEGLVY